MIVPVRCFSCGSPIGAKYEAFMEKVRKGEPAEKAMDELGIKRYCCRRMVFSHTDFMDEINKYKA